jgi:copper chaperone NosL
MLTRFLFNGELDRPARSIVAAAGVALFLALALPLWQMTMVSNQYPEGLRAIIYTYKLEGDLQEINTLNHYIGMQALNEDFFP